VRDLAKLRGDDEAELVNELTANAERVFGLDGSAGPITPRDR
jgi:hypothetical protein